MPVAVGAVVFVAVAADVLVAAATVVFVAVAALVAEGVAVLPVGVTVGEGDEVLVALRADCC